MVVSHKVCWPSPQSPTGYATDGGFPFQMQALSQLFEATTLLVPCLDAGRSGGEAALAGHELSIVPLRVPRGHGIWRKLDMPRWITRNSRSLWREIRRADAVHVPIPGDIGTVGLLVAFALRKRLFVRHCGNWFVQHTAAERFWKWFMERFAGGRNVMLATGGRASPPSPRNPALRWIFSTTLTADELRTCGVQRVRTTDSCRLIIVCRQEKAKGTAVVIDSLPGLLEHFPGAALDVVGGGSALAALKRRADALGVGRRVNFLGKVDHATVIRLLQQADVFCYPTAASEGFPKVVLEALACGLPVVTTRVSVLPELLASGCGVLLDEATPEALARAVGVVFADPARYRVMSGRAIETAGRYSLENWRGAIGERLQSAWGPLRAPNPE